jgi:hypothetical protein
MTCPGAHATSGPESDNVVTAARHYHYELIETTIAAATL